MRRYEENKGLVVPRVERTSLGLVVSYCGMLFWEAVLTLGLEERGLCAPLLVLFESVLNVDHVKESGGRNMD